MAENQIDATNPEGNQLEKESLSRQKLVENQVQTENPTTKNTKAIISLVTGIGGIVLGPIAFRNFLLCWVPLALSITAIVLGNLATREILQNPNQKISKGMAKAGLIIGWVGIGSVLLFVFLGFVLLLGMIGG